MAIFVDEASKTFQLDAGRGTMVLGVRQRGALLNLYYGAHLNKGEVDHLLAREARGSFFAVPAGSPETFSLELAPLEYSGGGMGDLRPNAICAVRADGDNVLDLRYEGYTILPGKPDLPGLPHTYLNAGETAQTLAITLLDSVKGARVRLYYTVWEAQGAISRWAEVENVSGQAFDLTKVMSVSLQFPDMNREMIHLYGAWGREFTRERAALHHNRQVVESFRGSSSHMHNPFAAFVSPDCGEESGEAYGVSLIYSSNFMIETDVDAYEQVRVNVGINERGFAWRLEPGERFTTPEAVLIYSDQGLGAMSRAYHRLYRRNLARGAWRDRPRPVLLNTWEGMYFDFNYEKLMAMARKAAPLGIELFVLDDGWFGKRDSDTCALGDWVVNEQKLGCTLAKLAGDIKALGMGFGLWFEPEMVSPDSDLYRAHPDWCLRQARREPSLGRNQLILDLSRKDVQDYVVSAVSSVLKSAEIAYVKWDMNRNMAEVGSAQLAPGRLGEIYHRYILGVYSVMERVTASFPNVLFESCSGGGGRFDPGILYYMPQNWTSDDSDAIQRLTIQEGCSLVYPPSAMTCHVSAVPNHQVGRVTPLHTRANVAMEGSFGYELNLNLLSPQQAQEVKAQIEEVKRYRHLVLEGELYRLKSPTQGNDAAFMVVSPDRALAVVTYVQVLNQPNAPLTRLKLCGLQPDAYYRVEGSGECYAGDVLMRAGLRMPLMNRDFDSVRLVLKRV